MAFPFLQAGKFRAGTGVLDEIISNGDVVCKTVVEYSLLGRGINDAELIVNNTSSITFLDMAQKWVIYDTVNNGNVNLTSTAEEVIADFQLLNGDEIVLNAFTAPGSGDWKFNFQGTGIVVKTQNFSSSNCKRVRITRRNASTVWVFNEVS